MDIFVIWMVLLGLFTVVALVLFIAALVSVLNSANYTNGLKALWALGLLAFPIIGPILWFAVGRSSHT